MKKISGFQRFIKFNSIDDEALKNAVPHIKLRRFPAGAYIFKQGSEKKEFYGIICGKISIRVRKSNYDRALHKIIKNRKVFEIKALSNNKLINKI